MAIGIDDLYDDDDILEPQPDSEVTLNHPSQSSSDEEDDFMSDFLKSKGIDDPSKIKFEDNNGNIIERNWNDLSRGEQINILNTPLTYEDNTNQFDEEEIALLNQIRNSGLTPFQYLQQIQGEQIVQEPVYEVDTLSDDEIYLLDLESRVGDLSEDEAAQALAIAKQNEDFFKKQVEGIRKEYKGREDYKNQQEQAELEEQQRQAYENYQAVIVDAINGFNSVGNLDLTFEDADKEELADFMLSQDENGANYLQRALQDPQTLVKAAWFILNGEEAFDNVADYFINQIKTVSENQYRKGYEDAKNGLQSKRPTVVIQKNNNQHRTYKSIDELYDED